MKDEDEQKQPETTESEAELSPVGDSTESDEVVEFEFNDDGEEDLKKTLKKLRADLKQVKKEKEEYLLGWQKERAEFANYKKEEDARKAMFSEAMRERILTRFLTVMDSFNMAFTNKEAWEKVDPNWRKGVEYIYSQMGGIFEEYGVKAIGEVGDTFDPNIHESIDLIPTDKKEDDHKIVEVVSVGYRLANKIIRAPKVKVGEYKN